LADDSVRSFLDQEFFRDLARLECRFWSRTDAIDCLDVLFIDEAGQMSLATALAAARSARNLVLLGDPQQLEQPTRGAHEDGADVAALESRPPSSEHGSTVFKWILRGQAASA